MSEAAEILNEYRQAAGPWVDPELTAQLERGRVYRTMEPSLIEQKADAKKAQAREFLRLNGHDENQWRYVEMRTFDTGATRDTDEGKYDYEGFLSPLVLERYAAYMHENRIQSDGSLRDGDNWQKGIPLDAYMKSAWRHFMDLWMLHRGIDFNAKNEELPAIDEVLCALLFNIQGYLFEILKDYDKDGMSRVSP